MRALIIGGGIAGAATAIALRKAGLDAAVYEAYPTGADDVGAFLTIMDNGMDALRAIDADELVRAGSYAATGVELFNDSGSHLGHQDVDGRTLRRATLYRLLHDEVTARGGRLEHGKKLVGARPAPGGGVVASFADGSHAEGDLLIGADGLHSAIRSVIDPGAPRPRYTGVHIVYGYSPCDGPARTEPGAYHMIFGKQAFFGYTTVPDGQTWWFARLPGAELTDTERTPDQWKQQAIECLADDDTPAAEIVRTAGDDVVGGNGYDIPATPRWHRASMVLVGDAAHAASPAAGQGASMALEDSVVLAKCLRDLPEVESAFRAYERLRRERTERLVAASARQTDDATPSGRDRRRREPAAGPAEYRIDWDTPVRPAETLHGR
ncbi:FAD-dependent oxidoreductase [Planosporangium mesophilum]|uniref:FAD-dependent oxidoreductase n=2 Tax=Planosporangium mesophilum TaxID=689768 RepID=A0A8J3X0S5_9ACTN|nr:FAD-dependent oxidoreductase [Planosporangium mesophilum]